MTTTPYLFDEFFDSGQEESISPFLTRNSRKWGHHLSLRSAFGASIFLVLSFSFSFSHPNLSYLFLTFVYFLSGIPALISACEDLKNLELNIDVLMTLAAFLAVLIGSGLEGALLLVLFELSHSMEHVVSHKTKSALNHLNRISPKYAHVVADDGTVYEKAIREIAIGTKLLIRQGEIAPLDGIVLEGSSSVNLVHLTGESIPDLKEKGDSIPAGARNLESALVIEVTRTSNDSTLSRIIHLITEAQEAKPRVQRFLDQFGKRYATTVILLTFFFAMALPWFLTIPYLGAEGGIYRALAFLIAASPCALIIATPTAYLSAISACARKGILLKGGAVLDALASCKAIAFDKTGTLTTGELLCVGVEPLQKTNVPFDPLGVAAALERHVVHPIATSITKLAEVEKFALPEIFEFKALPGYGLEGTLSDGTMVAIGRPEHIALKLSKEKAEILRNWTKSKKKEGEVLATLVIGTDLFAFRFTDQVRKETAELLRKIESINQLNPIMLTGDHAQNAAFVGQFLGIQTIYSELRPEDKLAKVAELSEQKGGLAMVGDGINDAPALARATVGISMGRIGSATAVDASDVVLLNDDLHLLSWLFSQSKKTEKIVRQNLILALGVILFATTPALLGWVPLWAAVILHEGGTVLVGLNSLRLLR